MFSPRQEYPQPFWSVLSLLRVFSAPHKYPHPPPPQECSQPFKDVLSFLSSFLNRLPHPTPAPGRVFSPWGEGEVFSALETVSAP